MYSLGVNLSHDCSACLKGPDGQLIAIAEERLDRSKHSCFPDNFGRWFTLLPIRSINYCLESSGIAIDDLDVVVFCNLNKAFYEITGVPLILNTSFNVAKQPIDETPTDAVECFLGTEIDYLYLQGFLLTKNCEGGEL